MPARVADFIHAAKDAILHSWEQRVTSEGHEVALVGAALRDDIPAVLDELARWLASDAAPEASQLGARTLDHAMQRLDEGLPLSQLLSEYRLLRETIIRFVLEAEEAEQERAVAREEARHTRVEGLARLNAGLDVVLSQSVEQLVTERDRRAAAERALSAQFRALASASSEVPYRMSPDWSEMRQLPGQGTVAHTDRPNANWLDEHVHADDRPKVTAAFREAIRTKSVFHVEHRARRADGSLEWTLSRAVPITDDEGEILEWFGSASDITERKQAEEALRTERDLSSAVLDTAGSLVIVFDRERRITRFNRACERATGYSAAEVMGRTFDFLIPPEQLPQVQHVWEDLLKGRFPNTYENHWVCKDGTRRLFAWSNTAIADQGGEVRHVIGTGMDITERKRVEDALREVDRQKSEYLAVLSRYRTLFESIDEGFCIIEMIFDEQSRPVDYRFVELNPAFERQTGLTGALGKRMREMVPDNDEHWFTTYGRVALTGEAVRFENRAEALGRWYDVYAFRFGNPDDHQVAVLFNDVSERQRAAEELRRSEATLAAFFDASPGILNIFDDQLRYLKTDRTTPTYFGLTQESIVGRSLEALAPEFVAHVRDMLREVVGSGATKPDQEVFSPAPGRPGEVLTWRASYFPVPLDMGRRGIGVVGVEITDLKKAEAAREELLQSLQDQHARKNEFLAMLSHELRNPLTPIRNSLYILERAAPGGDQARRAQAVVGRQVDLLARLVEDLLEITRLTSSKIQLQRDRLELRELVQRAIEDHRTTFERAGLTLEVTLAEEPAYVNGDWNRLAQVVGNLLQNSAKFTPSGGRVMVSLSVDEVERRAVLRVADTGVGMTPDVLDELFQPFSQAKQSLDRSKGGLGLGLALVKGLVDLHGGEVRADSAGVGRGSELTVLLPLDVQAANAGRAAMAPGQKPRLRILVIEDNIDAADSLRELIELDGHEVAVAYDGPDGIAKAREVRPDVVLCDIGLPGMDGYAVARALVSDEALRNARLVAVSGYALPEDLKRAAEAGFERHIAKPPSLEKLAAVLGDASAPSGDRREA